MRKGFKIICDICETFGALILGVKAVLMMETMSSIWTYLIIVNMLTISVVFAWDVGHDIGKALIKLAEK